MPKLEKTGISRVITIYVSLAVQAVLAFIAAGRTDLPRVWLYFILLFILQTFIFLLFLFRFPQMAEVINERGKAAAFKGFDAVFAVLYMLVILLMPVLIGLDTGRFGWSHLNVWWTASGIVLLLLSMYIMEWAIIENKFFETSVRIQKDREQYVVTTGPYSIVRHPGYLGMIGLYFSFPLITGSAWTLLLSAFTMLLFIARTVFEDGTLQKDLDGYKDYAKKVKYRLFPGIW